MVKKNKQNRKRRKSSTGRSAGRPRVANRDKRTKYDVSLPNWRQEELNKLAREMNLSKGKLFEDMLDLGETTTKLLSEQAIATCQLSAIIEAILETNEVDKEFHKAIESIKEKALNRFHSVASRYKSALTRAAEFLLDKEDTDPDLATLCEARLLTLLTKEEALVFKRLARTRKAQKPNE